MKRKNGMHRQTSKYKSTVLLSFLFLFIGVSVCNAQGGLTERKSVFKNPPKQYYPTPFWHMNGELTDSEIVRQMHDAKHKAKFNGVAVLPVGNTLPDFLSPAFFAKYIKILETARELDVNVILYDDTGFPSGAAGGKLEVVYPNDTRKLVEKTDTVVSGKTEYSCLVPNGKLFATVAMNTRSLERINLEKYIVSNKLTWTVPEGDWRIMFFNLVEAPGFTYKNVKNVDLLDPDAVSNFMKLTYDEYAKHFKEYFGNTIQLTFFDDVGLLKRDRTWTAKFDEKFKEVNGFEPTLYYPSLWYNIGPETEAARVAFFNTRSELIAEGYMKMVTQWTKKYNLKNTGHPPENYNRQPVNMSGDIFKFFRYTDIPLADQITKYGRGRDGFKLMSSTSDLYDRPITATEIYGNFKEEIVDTAMLYRALMEMVARGINYVVPHGMWYDTSKITIPPLVSPYSEKLAPALPDYSDYVGRVCYNLQGGRTVADIALLYPIASLQAEYYFDAPGNKGLGWSYPELDYLKIGDMLTNDIRRDFTFVHPEYLATDKYSLNNNRIHLNNVENFQDYNLIIIPAGKTISYKALQKIKAFYDAGGKVVFTSLLPSKSAEMGKDNEVVRIISEMLGDKNATEPKTNKNGGNAIFVPKLNAEILEKTLSDFTPNADVIFTDNPVVKSELGVFSYLHKVKDDRDIYYFANSSDDSIDTEVLLRGKLKLESWNPHTGITSKLENVTYLIKDSQQYTKCKLELNPVSSIFWIRE